MSGNLVETLADKKLDFNALATYEIMIYTYKCYVPYGWLADDGGFHRKPKCLNQVSC